MQRAGSLGEVSGHNFGLDSSFRCFVLSFEHDSPYPNFGEVLFLLQSKPYAHFRCLTMCYASGYSMAWLSGGEALFLSRGVRCP